MDSSGLRLGFTTMEPMTPHCIVPFGLLTRNEKILHFEHLRHQVHVTEALHGKISTPIIKENRTTYFPLPWRKLKNLHFSALVVDNVEEGCMIKCRTIVESLLFGSLQVLVEEVSGGHKVMMLAIENYVNDMNIMELGVLFPIGRELWIRNPCMIIQEGRPIIKLYDPTNLKLRQTSSEIERILEYGPIDAKGFRTKGNVLVKRGRLEEAVDAYHMGINYVGGNSKLKASLLRRRAEVLYDLEKHQAAHRDATASLNLSKDDRVSLLLAKILLELRAYSLAFDVVLQIEGRDEAAEALNQQLSMCKIEHEDGIYQTMAIVNEANLNNSVSHADYVSPKVELRAEGVGGRGLFAVEKLEAGTLLIASNPVLSVYVDEALNNADGEEKGLYDKIREQLTRRLIQMLNNSCQRRILQLAGGDRSTDINIDLRRDDVYDDDFHFLPDAIKQIVAWNSFGGAGSSHALTHVAEDAENNIGSGALFYAPSFLNHSCIPNSTYFTIGNMMFIKTNRHVEEGEELMIHYLSAEKLNEKDRNETLQRIWEFTCQCELCEWERNNEEISAEAEKITEKVVSCAKTESPDTAVKKILAAKKNLYKLHRVTIPQVDHLTTLVTPPINPPPSLARNLVILYRELSRVLRLSSRNNKLGGRINAEYHFVLKSYSHYEQIGVMGIPALRVWENLYRSPHTSSTTAIDAWLEEARKSHDMLLGEGHFEYVHGRFIKETMALEQ
jgi:tetratricopeptide (TPR) repeat protein